MSLLKLVIVANELEDATENFRDVQTMVHGCWLQASNRWKCFELSLASCLPHCASERSLQNLSDDTILSQFVTLQNAALRSAVSARHRKEKDRNDAGPQ